MKQHITEEELNTLSSEQQTKLHKLVRGDIQRHPFRHTEVTIGKMIEILSNKYKLLNITNIYARLGEGTPGWGVFNPKLFDIRADELCNALWEAVKQTLTQ